MGGSGKGGDDSMKWQQQAYDNAYNAFSQGQPLDMVLANQPNYQEASQVAYQDWLGSQGTSPFSFEMPEMPVYEPPDPMTLATTDYNTIASTLGDLEEGSDQLYGFIDNTWQIVSRADLPEDFQYGYSGKGNAYSSGMNSLNDMYGQYTDAVTLATDYITGQVSTNKSNANLLGLQYDPTQEQIDTEISNYLATLWSDTDQSNLQALIDEWGNPTGFTEFTYLPGDASAYTDTEPAEEISEGVSKGIKPKNFLDDTDDENKLGSPSILGD